MPRFNVSNHQSPFAGIFHKYTYRTRYFYQSFSTLLALTIPSAISNAWNEQYAGDSHHLLLKNVNRMSRSKPYSNSVPILQSSGSGKSRMVHEQSDLVFTLPFNLRAQSDSKGNSGFWSLPDFLST